MKTIKFVLLLLYWSSVTPVFSQEKVKKIGVGLGYYSSSIVGDSVRPFELVVRYHINRKHTLQLYVPLWMKNEHMALRGPKQSYVRQEDEDAYKHVYKHTLWGVGLGYDYTVYRHTLFDFFAGLNIDYQKYENREDLYEVKYVSLSESLDREPQYDDFSKERHSYYYYDRVSGVNLTPNIGCRLHFSRISIEAKLNLQMSFLKQQAYSKAYYWALFSTSEWTSYYPDKYRRWWHLLPNLSIHAFYYF